MIKLWKSTGNLSPYVRATNQALPLTGTVGTATTVKSESAVLKRPIATTNTTLRQGLPTGWLAATNSLITDTQVRFYHPSKLPQADFDNYRKEWGKNPSPAVSNRDKKAPLSYLVSGLALASALTLAKHSARTLAGTWLPGPAQRIAASIEIDLKAIPEGKSAKFEWRGKPIFVRHRTGSEITREAGVNVAELRDPQSDAERFAQPQWLVVIGVCTHLGCVPIDNAGDFGGYYCPCHGSHYDGSGRIRKGPAPLNLEVPPHNFTDEGMLIIG